MLLQRNQLPQGSPAPVNEVPPVGPIVMGAFDMNFVPPEWVKGPWQLVSYYFQCLEQKRGNGVAWEPPKSLGYNHKKYLRPAATLFAHGKEIACRTILHGVAIAAHPPGLYWIIRQALPEVEAWQNSRMPKR